jgi:protein LTV1
MPLKTVYNKRLSLSRFQVPLLPSSVFASRFEETVGVLNRAAPRSGPLLDWDPDIVETLDDDFKHEAVYTLKDEEAGGGEFDDFLAQAMGDVGGEGGDEEEEGEGDYDSDFGGAGSDYEADKDDAFETKSRFTEYSMSSSVVPRTEHMQRLDDQLEEVRILSGFLTHNVSKMFFVQFIDEYREDNIGSLEFDDIEGHKEPSPATVRQFVVEFKKQRELDRQKPEFQMAVIPEEYHYVVDEEEGDEEDEDKPMEPIIFEKEDRWDCESILSTYSNIYNHPKLIEVASIKKQVCSVFTIYFDFVLQ